MIGCNSTMEMEDYYVIHILGIDAEALKSIDDVVDSANAVGACISRRDIIQLQQDLSASSTTAENSIEILRELSASGSISSSKPTEPRIEPIRYRDSIAVRRNEVCTCGSGRKFKHCCRKARAPA